MFGISELTFLMFWHSLLQCFEKEIYWIRTPTNSLIITASKILTPGKSDTTAPTPIYRNTAAPLFEINSSWKIHQPTQAKPCTDRVLLAHLNDKVSRDMESEDFLSAQEEL